DYISVHDVRDEPQLREKYDVILFGPASSNALSIVSGVQGPRPLPWKKTDIMPNIGRQDETDDMRGGLELQGVLNLRNFIEAGGTFVTLTSSASLPIHFGLAPGISVRETENLWAPGGVFQTTVADAGSPLAYGYGEQLGVYFEDSPVFAVAGDRSGTQLARETTVEDGSTTGRRSGRGGIGDQDVVQARPRDWGREGVEAFRSAHEDDPEQGFRGFGQQQTSNARVVFRFAPDPQQLLISGGLTDGEELAGAPALVDVPLGEGHVVMFSFNPFWRSETLGSYALLFNALLHHGSLDAGAAVADR
ncbi:MAG: M14 family zinc carboxypeptidase, partial [Longimicrobiales bacterium]